MTFCPTVFDPDVLSLDIASFGKAPSEGRQIPDDFGVVGNS
jgi:hypothetical protein